MAVHAVQNFTSAWWIISSQRLVTTYWKYSLMQIFCALQNRESNDNNVGKMPFRKEKAQRWVKPTFRLMSLPWRHAALHRPSLGLGGVGWGRWPAPSPHSPLDPSTGHGTALLGECREVVKEKRGKREQKRGCGRDVPSSIELHTSIIVWNSMPPSICLLHVEAKNFPRCWQISLFPWLQPKFPRFREIFLELAALQVIH